VHDLTEFYELLQVHRWSFIDCLPWSMYSWS